MNPEDELLKQIDEHVQEINYNARWFLGSKVKRAERQNTLLRLQSDKIRNFIDIKLELRKLQRNLDEIDKVHDYSIQATIQQSITLVEAEKLRRKLIQAASDLGMTIEDYSEVQKQQALVNVEVDKAEKMTGVEVEKHRQLKEVDLEFYKQETAVKLQAALAYQQISIEQTKYLLVKLGQLKTELYELYFSRLPIQLIEAKAKDYQTVIQGWEKKLERLIQGDNGEDAGRGDENPFRRGLTGPDMAEGEK